eukprot:9456560-Pyramimonas_sp.AAC.1
MRSSTAVVCDEGNVTSLMHTCPAEFRELLREGVSRWQSRQTLSHLPGHLEGGEEVWMRALPLIVGGSKSAVRRPQMAGALRLLWSGGFMSVSKRFERRLLASPMCPRPQ